LLIKGGGHAMAAGVTLRKDALAGFRAYLEAALGDVVAAARRDDALKIDGALTAAAATAETITTLAQAGPFGAGNPEPVVVLPAHTIAYADEVGQAHVKVRLRAGDGAGVNAIAFRAVGQKLGAAITQNRGRALHVAGCLALDRWQGEERVQFRILDVAPADSLAGR
jgi:single-stranded-DNA-specific exonuclease